jgi:hypothetical protein
LTGKFDNSERLIDDSIIIHLIKLMVSISRRLVDGTVEGQQFFSVKSPTETVISHKTQ